MKRCIALVVTIVLSALIRAQDLESMGGGLKVKDTPKFKTRLSAGFNYDILRDPTDISFLYSRGYLGCNLPLDYTVNPLVVAGQFTTALDSLFLDTALFESGDQFEPQTGAQQHANSTVRVDVPMLGGVCSFSHIQNVYLDYLLALGSTHLDIAPDSIGNGMDLMIKGAVNVPVGVTLGWETMSFGYAYEVTRELVLALNLHRHIFTFDLLGRVDVDMLINFSIEQPPVINIRKLIDFNSEKLYGTAQGQFQAEAWSPALAARLWRLHYVGRFGFETEADGVFAARYTLPFFIDPQTFELSVDFSDPNALTDPSFYNGILDEETDSVVYYSNNPAKWKLPDGHTFTFDILRRFLSVSYTKINGDIEMFHRYEGKDSIDGNDDDRVDLDLGISVDHITVVNFHLGTAYLNLGMFTLDIRIEDEEHILGSMYEELVGEEVAAMSMINGAPMLPVLNFGTAIGTKWQFVAKMDILPLLAVQTGVMYHF